jgi:ketosteroid isomerase-like protein
MPGSNEQVVRDAVGAMQRGDMDALGGYFSDDVVLHVPGAHGISGDYKGKYAFFNTFMPKLMSAACEGFNIDIHDVVANDEHVVGLYKVTAKGGGREASWNHVNVYHVRDGKIVEFWHHPGDFVAVTEFFS